jgi:hypothetical protein
MYFTFVGTLKVKKYCHHDHKKIFGIVHNSAVSPPCLDSVVRAHYQKDEVEAKGNYHS